MKLKPALALLAAAIISIDASAENYVDGVSFK
jgi:hypothetical protein